MLREQPDAEGHGWKSLAGTECLWEGGRARREIRLFAKQTLQVHRLATERANLRSGRAAMEMGCVWPIRMCSVARKVKVKVPHVKCFARIRALGDD